MLRTFIKCIREYLKLSILTFLCMIGEVLMEVLLPFIMAQMIDKVSDSATPDMTPIIIYGSILLGMAFVSLFFGFFGGKLAAIASTGFAKNVRKDMFYKIQEFSFADTDKFSPSSLVTRMTTDIMNVQMGYQIFIRGIVRSPLMLIFSIVMTLIVNVEMSLIFLIMVPVLAVVLFLLIRIVFPIFNRIFKKYDVLNNSIQENISGIRVVKSFVREDYEAEKFDKASEDVRKNFTKAERILALNSPIMTFCIFCVITLVSFFGARMIVSSGGTSLTTGELSSFINYGVQILSALLMLSMLIVMLTMAAESGKRIIEVLNYKPTLTSPKDGVEEMDNGSISFKNVNFKYKQDSDNFALSNINLDIKSGQTIGIIGGTGSSKTTLIQLISRLYDTSEGEVDVGGVNVKDYDLTYLRNQVAVVLQKNVLFSGTIIDNMRWGNENASLEEIEQACKVAQADEFIQGFPKKYETYIEQGGTNVSGGQKQRLCIARALLKNPKILILDDSTSAVDTKTDALIRRSFKEIIPNTTKIIIAQRVSSVEEADQILVMDNGKIVEQGTNEELIKLNGIYREVYDSQVGTKEGL